ncbi:MAG: hypothetical protein RMY00_22700 [Nostoc sp. ChiVER01]|nr:hypothetical protein [Nostoc sp. ChiVER01]
MQQIEELITVAGVVIKPFSTVKAQTYLGLAEKVRRGNAPILIQMNSPKL